MTDADRLLIVFDAYRAATGLAAATVSGRFLGRSSRIRELLAGGDIGSRRACDAIAAFKAAWPEGAAWPLPAAPVPDSLARAA